MSILATVSVTSCDPVSRTWAWKGGATHGVLIETTAGRASLEIYRTASRKLHEVYVKAKIKGLQDVMWAFGKPPAIRKTFSYKGRSITLEFGAATSALRSIAHDAIYNRPSDLVSALADAHVEDNCLALTLISYGKRVTNWTRKNLDCRNGSLP